MQKSEYVDSAVEAGVESHWLGAPQPLSVWLSYHLAYVSVKQLQNVVRHFGSLQAGLQASLADWQASNILRDKQLKVLLGSEVAAKVAQVLAWQEQAGQQLLTLDSPLYPPLLREISEPPILLYVKGSVDLLRDPQLAVVGSRHASRTGLRIAEDFSRHLSQQGLTISSGLASGVDAAAHKGGLQGVGSTVAVMGTGIDRVYPAAHRQLAHQIAEQGALVSEFPLGTRPLAYQFPRRNRIISGLSVGVLVVEAALKSGSLITAKLAMEQGREVFAVPGSIYHPQARGCHQLIKQGAKLVETGQEVLEELLPLIEVSLQQKSERGEVEALKPGGKQDDLFGLTEVRTRLFRYMDYEPISLDELVVLTKMPASEIQVQLMMLELEGLIEPLSGSRWRRLPEYEGF